MCRQHAGWVVFVNTLIDHDGDIKWWPLEKKQNKGTCWWCELPKLSLPLLFAYTHTQTVRSALKRRSSKSAESHSLGATLRNEQLSHSHPRRYLLICASLAEVCCERGYPALRSKKPPKIRRWYLESLLPVLYPLVYDSPHYLKSNICVRQYTEMTIWSLIKGISKTFSSFETWQPFFVIHLYARKQRHRSIPLCWPPRMLQTALIWAIIVC